MEQKSKAPAFYVVNVGGLLLALSIVGDTSRFVVISLTLVSWLQTQWLAYTSVLRQRRSARLAAAVNDDQVRKRKQIADITGAIAENVILMLDTRRQELVLRLDQEWDRKRRSYREDIVKKITNDLAEFQEVERIKDEVRIQRRESRILDRERELNAKEEALQARQKELEEREQRLKASKRALQTKQQVHAITDSLQDVQSILEKYQLVKVTNESITLPSDLLQYGKDLESGLFTCIGVTKKGARCRQSFISNADKSAAARRIAQMASTQHSNDRTIYELPALRELADWMLCPRWHRDALPQGDGIARRWYGELCNARAVKSQAVAVGSAWETPVSTKVPSVFDSVDSGYNSAGTAASSVGSSISKSYFQSTSPRSAASGQQNFTKSAARDLTPSFRLIAEQSAMARKGFGGWE